MNLDNNKKKIAIVSSIAVVIAAVLFVNVQVGPYDKNNKENIVIEIPSGSTTKSISKILYSNKLIKNELLFEISARLSNKASTFKSGQYLFNQGYSNNEIINKISDGRIYVTGTKVTIPEGSTSFEIIDKLVENEIGTKEVYLELINNPEEFYDKFEFLKADDIISLEGFLYPETYTIEDDSTEKQVLEIMLSHFDRMYTEELKEKQKELDMTLQEVVNLASIVEKEAVFDEDRPIIASVFFNRLDINMPLQSDATIQYAFDERKQIVSYDDLKIDSPYNSYKNYGLPPTPIANPSIKSIEGVLEPAETEYLYFVATMQGGNNYSTNYQDHLKYVKEYKDERDKLKNN